MSEPVTLVAGGSRRYVWDFSNKREVQAGGTLTSPTVPAVAGLTIGTVEVLAASHCANGVSFDGVPIGKGVTATVTSSTPGTYVVTAFATIAGAVVPVKDKLVVESATA